jgi:hypothetical protein
MQLQKATLAGGEQVCRIGESVVDRQPLDTGSPRDLGDRGLCRSNFLVQGKGGRRDAIARGALALGAHLQAIRPLMG